MKKKFFAMYALVGALVASPVFTSCVDDSVSPSVEAIRNAKAEQLKALAELDKAQAAYQLAQAALKNAEAEYKANETAEAKAKFVYQIESIKAQYEASVMQYKYNKAQYENWLKEQEEDYITDAAKRYTDALDAVNELNEDLFIAKANLAQVGIDSAKNVALLNEYIAGQNATIAKATADIERIKAYEGETKASLDEKKAAVVANYKKLSNDLVYAEADDDKAKDAQTEAKTAFQETEYRDAITDLRAYSDMEITGIPSENIVTPNNATGFTIHVGYEMTESGILKTKKSLKDALATAKTTLGAPSTAAGANDASGCYIQLETLEAALKTAQDNLANNTDATQTATLEGLVEDAQVDLAEYKEDFLQPALDAVKDAEDAIADFDALLATVAEGSEAQKEYAAAVEAYLASVEAWIATDKKVEELEEAIEATGITSINGDIVTAASSGEYAILDALYSEDIDAATKIAELEADIAEAKANIETGLAANYLEETTETETWWDADGNRHQIQHTVYVVVEVANTEIVKAIYEAEIAAIESELAVQKQLLAKYEAELQALLATEEEA